MKGALVCVVDDELCVRRSTELLLRSNGYDVALFASGEELLNGGAPRLPGCALFDMRMPGMDGLKLLAAIQARGWTLPVILTSGHTDATLGGRAIMAGAFDVVEKPYSERDLVAAIETAMRSIGSAA